MSSEPELPDIAAEAWLYFYPLVLMQVTRRADKGLALDEWKHAGELRGAGFEMVIRPNVDTMYSHAWLDLSTGPVAVEVPDTGGRHYVLQAVDDWSLTFATVGTRTTGNGARSFVFVPPGEAASGPWPTDATVIAAPTRHVWLLLRIQAGGPDEIESVRTLQSRFELRALGDEARQAPAPDRYAAELAAGLRVGARPPALVADLEARVFFEWATQLWGSPGIAVPDHDDELVGRVAQLGMIPGTPLDWATLAPGQVAALDAAKDLAFARLAAEAAAQGGAVHDGWYYLRDNWFRVQDHLVLMQQPTNYTLRAGLALEALGLLPLQEATYVSAGVPRVGGEELSGADGQRYTIRFEPGRLPPVRAFWSVTVYEGAGYLADNPIGRHNLGSRDALLRDRDGGLTLHLAADNPHGPDSDDATNWLPIPAGEFSVSFRAYWPTEPIVHDGDGWHVPPVLATPQP